MKFVDKPTILLMFSGGLDSVAALYYLLTDAQYSDFVIHSHRINFINRENRNEAERIATANIYEYFRRYVPREFYTSESTFDIGKSLFWDKDVYLFIAANICLFYPQIKMVATGKNKDDDGNTAEYYVRCKERTDKLWELYTDVQRIYPVVSLTKRDYVSILPKSLIDMAWSCRTPIKTEFGFFKECGKCRTCKEKERLGISGITP
jgi:7-cyano-7-deazaguanine synthase in queuosine biosynthesis